MVLNDNELAALTAINRRFLEEFGEGVDEDSEIPIYVCNPLNTAETAALLARAGYKVYCPYFMARVRKNRRSKAKIDAALLYFSGYIFVAGKSPKDMFPDRVARLRFGEMFGSIDVKQLTTFRG